MPERSLFPQIASITSDLLIGTNAADGLLPEVLQVVATCVPQTSFTHSNTSRFKKAVEIPMVRGVFAGSDYHGARFNGGFFCADQSVDGLQPQMVSHRWRVGVSLFEPDAFNGLIENRRSLVRLRVTNYEIYNHGVAAAQHLALARSIFVECYEDFDPDAVVLGGQHRWDPAWWPDNGGYAS